MNYGLIHLRIKLNNYAIELRIPDHFQYNSCLAILDGYQMRITLKTDKFPIRKITLKTKKSTRIYNFPE
jgi:hypothetical protein